MAQNRWFRELSTTPARSRTGDGAHPAFPSLEVSYLTDPDVLATALPPPLEAPEVQRVHARITEINIEHGGCRYHEMVEYFALDAVFDGTHHADADAGLRQARRSHHTPSAIMRRSRSNSSDGHRSSTTIGTSSQSNANMFSRRLGSDGASSVSGRGP